jgi:hypothetical protein
MQNSARNNRKSPYVQRLMNDLGMYQYSGDPFGKLRNQEKSTEKAWWHDAVTKPADPLIRPALRWFFTKTEDVGAGSFTPANAGSGTPLALIDKRGGWARSINGTADNNYYTYFSLSEVARMVDGYHIWFDTEILIDDVDQADFFVGLCATLGSGDLFDNRVDCIGFTLADGSGALNYVGTQDGAGSPTALGYTLTDAEEVRLSFVVSGLTRVDFFINDIQYGSVEANLPDDEELALAFGLRNGQAAANAFSITTTSVLLD